jgi:broad specificity phosphatase PhoE
MSTLHLVRHAQASFMGDDYDVLSDLGHAQARRLGERWVALGLRFDAVFVGPRRRQRHTADLVGEVVRGAGLPWPDPQVLEALDEYHAEPVLKQFVPQVAERDPEVRALVAAFSDAADPRGRAQSFERLFQAMMRRWAADAFGAPDVETWDAFRDRVDAAMATLTLAPRPGARLAAFSSGGAIGLGVGRTLGVADEASLELGWMLNNCSVCEILFSGDRCNLSRFNDIAHLSDPAYWTYR